MADVQNQVIKLQFEDLAGVHIPVEFVLTVTVRKVGLGLLEIVQQVYLLIVGLEAVAATLSGDDEPYGPNLEQIVLWHMPEDSKCIIKTSWARDLQKRHR